MNKKFHFILALFLFLSEPGWCFEFTAHLQALQKHQEKDIAGALQVLEPQLQGPAPTEALANAGSFHFQLKHWTEASLYWERSIRAGLGKPAVLEWYARARQELAPSQWSVEAHPFWDFSGAWVPWSAWVTAALGAVILGLALFFNRWIALAFVPVLALFLIQGFAAPRSVAYVVVDQVSLLSGPGENQPALGTMKRGDRSLWLGEKENWSQVEVAGNLRVWVARDKIKVIGATAALSVR